MLFLLNILNFIYCFVVDRTGVAKKLHGNLFILEYGIKLFNDTVRNIGLSFFAYGS